MTWTTSAKAMPLPWQPWILKMANYWQWETYVNILSSIYLHLMIWVISSLRPFIICNIKYFRSIVGFIPTSNSKRRTFKVTQWRCIVTVCCWCMCFWRGSIIAEFEKMFSLVGPGSLNQAFTDGCGHIIYLTHFRLPEYAKHSMILSSGKLNVPHAPPSNSKPKSPILVNSHPFIFDIWTRY